MKAALFFGEGDKLTVLPETRHVRNQSRRGPFCGKASPSFPSWDGYEPSGTPQKPEYGSRRPNDSGLQYIGKLSSTGAPTARKPRGGRMGCSVPTSNLDSSHLAPEWFAGPPVCLQKLDLICNVLLISFLDLIQLIGCLLVWLLYGVLLIQAVHYAESHASDDRPIWLHILALIVALTQGLQICFFTKFTWRLCVKGLFNPIGISIVTTTAAACPILNGFMALFVQSYFSWQMYVLAQKNRLATGYSILVVCVSLTQFLSNIMIGKGFIAASCDLSQLHVLKASIMIAYVINSVGDALITVGLTSILWYYRKDTMFDKTRSILNKLIVNTIENGFVTTVCAVTSLILFVLRPKDTTSIAVYELHGVLYAIVFFVTLNRRQGDRDFGTIFSNDILLHHRPKGSSMGGPKDYRPSALAEDRTRQPSYHLLETLPGQKTQAAMENEHIGSEDSSEHATPAYMQEGRLIALTEQFKCGKQLPTLRPRSPPRFPSFLREVVKGLSQLAPGPMDTGDSGLGDPSLGYPSPELFAGPPYSSLDACLSGSFTECCWCRLVSIAGRQFNAPHADKLLYAGRYAESEASSDRPFWVHVLALVIILTQGLEIAFFTSYTWSLCVLGPANPVGVMAAPPGSPACPILNGLMTLQMYVLAQRHKLAMGYSMLIILVSLTQCIFNVIIGVGLLPSGCYLCRLQDFKISITASLTSSAVGDALITIGLTSLLRYYREDTIFPKTKNILNQLIVNTVENGFVTLLCALASLIAYIFRPRDAVSVAIYELHGVLYAIVFFATLNRRQGGFGSAEALLASDHDLVVNMEGNCDIEYDWFTTFLTFGLCVGLVVSYLPQHLRIIQAKSSEGLSPLFLLLGSTSAASALLNIITVQSGVLKCCSTLGPARCLDISAGVVQLSIQWVCFTLVFVLYMIYYPEHLKYEGIQLPVDNATVVVKSPKLRTEWKLSIIYSWLTAIHFVVIALTTIFILATAVPSPSAGEPLPPALYSWARFLGVSAATFATIQYMPQLIHTYRTKLVGALSIPMMCIQTPGGVLMVLSIALRPGTNWTSWITFAVAAVLQGTLLVMCFAWKFRQQRLGIDDFGVPLGQAANPDLQVEVTVAVDSDNIRPGHAASGSTQPSGNSDEQTPLLSKPR
ncbi:hypothetical protein NMY22_g10820 [Coprinellus aureogranulatus]|nr:hypothetical protein NMY22_g10820 [Coprinellus aureogranulatus]